MDEQADRREDLDGWPMPSRDVLRELERPSPSWYGHDAEFDPAPVRAAA